MTPLLVRSIGTEDHTSAGDEEQMKIEDCKVGDYISQKMVTLIEQKDREPQTAKWSRRREITEIRSDSIVTKTMYRGLSILVINVEKLESYEKM